MSTAWRRVDQSRLPAAGRVLCSPSPLVAWTARRNWNNPWKKPFHPATGEGTLAASHISHGLRGPVRMLNRSPEGSPNVGSRPG